MVAVSPELNYENVRHCVAADGLDIMGALHDDDTTLFLLGPGPDFWSAFRHAAELTDGQPDPFDRWSLRVIRWLADMLGADHVFPFGGPPYAPFLRWALASGRAWSSPVGMLVHDTAGLMISYRGALRFAAHIDLPDPPAVSPCASCIDKPCTTACPVSALNAHASYAVDTCHAHLDTPAGQICLTMGCIARRACPISRGFNRVPAQSALHMRAFHPS